MNCNAAPCVERGFRVVRLARRDFEELFITGSGRTLAETRRVLEDLEIDGVLRAEVFEPHTGIPGGNGDNKPWDECPLTRVLGESDANDRLGGVHIHAVKGAPVKYLALDGRTVGALLETPDATECFLSDIRSVRTAEPRGLQARDTFEGIENALALAGMDFANVVRTWLFLDDILDWYDEFNPVRTGFFHARDVFNRMVPASTGIGGANPAGAAVVAAAYALRQNGNACVVQALPSPLQCPALQYGSSFSRAAEACLPDVRRVFVSGTASIDPDGSTVHIGDVEKQVERTCEVVEAILESRGMGWDDVTRATAYVRYPEDAGVFPSFLEAAGLPCLPVVEAHNTICRDDLLFELEVDAVQAK